MSNGIAQPVIIGLIVGIGFVAGVIMLSDGLQEYYPGLARVSPDFPRVVTPNIRILEGSSLASNPPYLEPEVATVIIGFNETVAWKNEDTVAVALSSDNNYTDPFSGQFDTRVRPTEDGGPFIMPGETWSFAFTQPGEYGYHGEPHPWIHGTVIAKKK